MPDEETPSVEHILRPFTNVPVTVGPAVLALAFLASILVEALVHAGVIPLLLAEAVLLVLVPVTYILRAVGVLVNTKALSHVIHEFSFIEVATCMVQLSSAVIKVIFPKPFINRTVGPPHDAVAMLGVLRILQHLP